MIGGGWGSVGTLTDTNVTRRGTHLSLRASSWLLPVWLSLDTFCLVNQQTYGTPAVTITPGPRLNLVLGPNGEGVLGCMGREVHA